MTISSHVCDCGARYDTANEVLLCGQTNHGNPAPRPFLVILREANLSRVSRFGHGGLREWSPMQWGCALAGEVGELCNVLKKYERQLPTDPTPDDLRAAIGKEIADVAIYLDLLAAWFDYDLARLIERKFNESSKRLGFPERI